MESSGVTALGCPPAIAEPVSVLHRIAGPGLAHQGRRAASSAGEALLGIGRPGNQHLPWLGDNDAAAFHGTATQPIGAPPPATHLNTVLGHRPLSPTSSAQPSQLAQVGDAAWSAPAPRGTSRSFATKLEGASTASSPSESTPGDVAVSRTLNQPGFVVAQAARAILDGLAAQNLHAPGGLARGKRDRETGGRWRLRGGSQSTYRRPASWVRPPGTRSSSRERVRDLTAGSGLRFEDRGTHTLKACPRNRQVVALA